MVRAQNAERAEAELIERIYDTTLEPSLWPTVMERVAAAMGGNCTVMFFFDPRAKRLIRDVPGDFPNREIYLRDFAAADPRNRFGVTAPAGVSFTDDAFITAAQIERSEFYQDYLLPNDMGHVAAHMLQNDGDGIAGVAVQRPYRQAPFGTAELRLLERLAPHLRRVLRLQVRLGEAAKLPWGWSLDLLHGLSWGILALDGDLLPVFVNRAAEGLLAKTDGLRVDRQGLHAAHPWDAHRLREALARALRGSGGELRVRRPSGEPDWIVSVAPTRELLDHLRAAVRIFVHLLDPAARPSCAPERLRALFDLSPAEARVATALLSGLHASEIATRHGVAISTVRTQVEQLLSKTGTERQLELRALLERIALLPARSP